MNLLVDSGSLQLLVRASLNLLEALGTVWEQSDPRQQNLLEQQMLRLLRTLADMHQLRSRIDEQMRLVQGRSRTPGRRQGQPDVYRGPLGSRVHAVRIDLQHRMRPKFADQLEACFQPLMELYREDEPAIVNPGRADPPAAAPAAAYMEVEEVEPEAAAGRGRPTAVTLPDSAHWRASKTEPAPRPEPAPVSAPVPEPESEQASEPVLEAEAEPVPGGEMVQEPAPEARAVATPAVPASPEPPPVASKPDQDKQANAGPVLLIPKKMVRIKIGGRLYSEVER
ncbi:hypothetical protein PA598K_04378 [Paenibacillus sp. 598K]|uniref:hypothetical protein n=1 Tax=Paenibacillus sp. 598K TaxID=1117987 RepID=UPI000FF90661|nr:hypothetical protein [Paenibacillus sp. 598K]GBF75942.1 hypothetical protein PA598K_04378 [Paenibacillus sp. 598K]